MPFLPKTTASLLCGFAALILVFALQPKAAPGQSRITGKVFDAKTGEPLPGANVFIDGEMKGTATDEEGQFVLTNLTPGTHTIIGSMVGYKPKQASVSLEPASEVDEAAPSIRFALEPQPVQMKGVTVKDNRDEWLERLERFRRAFFGTVVPNADQCSFINPEVLSFEESGQTLIAHAEKPLRVRNEGLGYEITFYLSQYNLSSNNRTRLGPFEFDTLEANSPEQRKEWAKARRETYRGSYFHFIDALRAGALVEEGFRVRLVDQVREVRTAETQQRDSRMPEQQKGKLLSASDIFSSTDRPGVGVLSLPDNSSHHEYLQVRYVKKQEHPQFAERLRKGRRPRSFQLSWIQFIDGDKALIDVETGDFKTDSNLGYFVKHGYWGWYKTAATTLPATYRPSDAP